MKLVYALNINASIEAESTNDRPTTFTAPLVPPHSLNPVLRLPQQTPQYLSQQQNLQHNKGVLIVCIKLRNNSVCIFQHKAKSGTSSEKLNGAA